MAINPDCGCSMWGWSPEFGPYDARGHHPHCPRHVKTPISGFDVPSLHIGGAYTPIEKNSEGFAVLTAGTHDVPVMMNGREIGRASVTVENGKMVMAELNLNPILPGLSGLLKLKPLDLPGVYENPFKRVDIKKVDWMEVDGIAAPSARGK